MANDLRYTLSLKDLFSKKMEGALKSTEKMDGKMASLNKGFSSLGGVLAGAFTVGAAVSFGKSVVDSLTKYEYFSASLRTLMHGDKNAANLLNNQLVQLAKVTPFSLEDVRESSQKLLAYGFSANQVVDTMKTLGDVSAATGNNIGDVAYLYGTLKTQGKAMTKDLYQFTNRGINIIPLLAKQFGILESQVYDYASSGRIGFADVEKAFKTMTGAGGDFFGMMDEQSKTTGGRLSNLGDAWEQLKISIGQSQSGILNSTISFVSEFVTSINDMWQASDKIEKSFAKFGAKDYTKIEKFNKLIGLGGIGKGDYFTGGQMGDIRQQKGLQQTYIDPSGENLLKAQESQKKLTFMIANMHKERGKMTQKERDETLTAFNRDMAMRKGALEEVSANVETFKKQNALDKESKLNKNKEDKLTKVEQAKSTGVEVKAARPQDLTINITKLVETLNIKAENLKDSAIQIKEAIAKALLEAVNDVNTIIR